jgi:hypothetical protein
MTPIQYYFPYFFSSEAFNKALAPFGLFSQINYSDKTKMTESLALKEPNSKDILLTIPFDATLMIERSKLFYWNTDTNLIDITQFNLLDIGESELINTKVDLSQLQLGKNSVKTCLDVDNLVTYTRMNSLSYPQDYYENFVIAIIQREQIILIPFDWFNKTGGDFGYVWPATAQLEKGKLYGQGMRMANFKVELSKEYL